LQSSFDWRGVAVSAIATGAGYSASNGVQSWNMGDAFNRAAGGVTAGVMSTLLRGGSVGHNLGAIAADVIGSTIGNAIAEQVAASSIRPKIYGSGDPYSGNFQVDPAFSAQTGVTPMIYGGKDGSMSSAEFVMSRASSNPAFDARIAATNGSSVEVLGAGRNSPAQPFGVDTQGPMVVRNQGYSTTADFLNGDGTIQFRETAYHYAPGEREAYRQENKLIQLGANSDALGPDFAAPVEKMWSLEQMASQNYGLVRAATSGAGWRAIGQATNNFLTPFNQTPLTPSQRAVGTNTFLGALGIVGKEVEPMAVFGMGLSPGGKLAARANNTGPVSFANRVPGETFSIEPVPLLSTEQALRTPGKILYVVKEDGSLVIARTNSNNLFGHFDLAKGENILAGGEGRIYSGQVRSLDNASGHYLPEGPSARDFAVTAFRNAGFTVPKSAYVEKIYDFTLGKWVPK
jgi:hypothetical protein